MKRKLLSAILATAAIAFSCTMQEEGALQTASVVSEPTAIIADFVAGGAPTKTVATFNESSVSFAFTASDVLRAYPVSPEQGDGMRFTVKSNSGTACVFSGEGFGLEEGQKYAAYYPGDSDIVPDVTAVPVSFLGQSQPAANEWNLSNVDFLYATGIEPANGACSFAMKHLGALLIIDVTFEEAGVYKELSLTTDEPFIAKGTVDLTADEIEIDFDEDTDMAETITLALGGDNGMAVEANQTVSFYMMMAPDDLQAEAEITVAITDVNNEVTILNKATGFAFESGKAYKFGYTIEAPFDASIYGVNLGAEETANCYIVSEAGNYYFDASVAGNGVAGIIPGQEGTWYPAAGTCTFTDIPNATNPLNVMFNENGCISSIGYDAEHKIIYFTASGAEGNAKITLQTGAVGMWTWHIWCTDEPATVTYTNSKGNTFSIMDRNLGATILRDELQSVDDIAKLCGLYYQWGRPIPFTAEGTATAFGPDDTNTTQRFTFYYPQYFMYTSDNKFMTLTNGMTGPGQAVRAFGLLWGNNVNTCTLWKPVSELQKTLYDPCPPGYQVAPVDFMIDYSDTSNADQPEFTADPYGVYLAGTNGTLYYPYNGRCFGGMLAQNGGNARFSTLATGESNLDGCGLWIWTSGNANNNTSWNWHLSYKDDNTATWGGTATLGANAYAMGIRCVADDK